jgi:phosphatidylglycerophosphate synthase
MPVELWIFIVLLILFLLGLVSYIVTQMAKARKEFEKIDYSKLKKWKDDDW